MMSQIVNLNDSISEQRFIDININDNDDQQLESPRPKTRSAHGSDNSIKSIFNFINNENKKTPLKKLNSELTPKPSTPITKKSPLQSSLSVPPTNLPKPIPNDFQMKLADIVINSSECSEDDEDEDEDDLMNLKDEKLLELNRNVKTLKKNSYIASPSLSSLKEKECDRDLPDFDSPLKHDPHSTPMRHASSSTIFEPHDTNDELHGMSSSLVSDSDATLSLTECSDSSHNKSGNLELREMLSRNDSIVDGLLGDIYDRFNISLKENFNESDAFTDLTVSSFNLTESKSWQMDSDLTESNAKYNYGKGHVGMRSSLKKLDIKSLNSLVNELTLKSNQTSTKLIKQLRQKDKLLLKLDKNSDILTSILQARSLKRSKQLK